MLVLDETETWTGWDGGGGFSRKCCLLSVLQEKFTVRSKSPVNQLFQPQPPLRL